MKRRNSAKGAKGEGFRPKHSLGQNFLLEDSLVSSLAELSLAGPEDCVLEIGPGMGTMTRQLALRCRRLVAIEVDRSLEPYLNAALSGLSNAEVRYADVMRTDLKALGAELSGQGPLRIAANLPYYITTEILKKCLKELPQARSMAFMVQKEVADKLLSDPGQEGYGPLPILCQRGYTIARAMEVEKERFTPSPHVDSTFVVLERRKVPLCPVQSEEGFARMLHGLFLQRRKTLINGLAGQCGLTREEALELVRRAGFSDTVRAEALPIEALCRLSDLLEEGRREGAGAKRAEKAETLP